jgi:hypothetical protein
VDKPRRDFAVDLSESSQCQSGLLGSRCTIWTHPARPQIDLAIATGLSKRAIAQRFNVSPDAAWRHNQSHLTTEMCFAAFTTV